MACPPPPPASVLVGRQTQQPAPAGGPGATADAAAAAAAGAPMKHCAKLDGRPSMPCCVIWMEGDERACLMTVLIRPFLILSGHFK